MTAHSSVGRTALTAIAFLCAVPAVSVATGPGDFDIETVLADGMWNNPTTTGIDENGVIHTAYMATLGTSSELREIWYARKAPGGPWQFTQVTDNNVREELPCLRLDADGNVHITFSTGVPGGTNMVRCVNNVGQAVGNFNPIVEITGNGFAWPRLAVDSNGVAHFSFRSHNLVSAEDVFYRSYKPGTNTLGPLVNISNSPAQDDFGADIAVDADDVVHIAWMRGSALGGPLGYVNNSSGSFQSVATGVAGSVIDPKLVVDGNNRLSIFYRPGLDALSYIERTPEGFSSPQPVYIGTYRSAFMERVAVDVHGRRHVAFASNIAANRGTFYVEETEDGWAEPLRLAGEGGGNQGTSIAVNSAGQLVVTWSISGFDCIVYADIFAATRSLDIGPACPADLNDDGVVDVLDMLALFAA